MNPKVVIDLGHGGSDPGAVNASTGLREADVVLTVGLFLERMLQDNGVECMLTRVKDVDVAYPNASASEELQARCDIANEFGADLFVSIHCDSFSNPQAQGTSTHYYASSEEGRKLAEKVQFNLLAALGRYDRGIRTADFYVLKHTTCPAVLVEGAFISNPEEEQLLQTDDFRYRYAWGLWQGIESYLGISTKEPEKPHTDEIQAPQEQPPQQVESREDWSDAGLRNRMSERG
jgi:N-acetylmuramoyl-L-alanine amidase